ncbi:hypothetical protein BGZ65_010659 [Modicella reniformis]|uniref:Afadin and alpha-actinin-binding-domain-containing protein n=1 Tax=Modicella reniformis TaxID=1440133 RepID=A0A9P6MAI1_9FUNG|nr:hypothetical protein BGZ65_010659 [Modicella reniformis]
MTDSLIRGLDESYLEANANAWHEDDDVDLDQEEEEEEEGYYIPNSTFMQELAAANPSMFQDIGVDFSTEENLDQTSAYINHQLGVHGFSSNLQFVNADKTSASRIVTTFYKIIQQHLKNVKYKEEMDLNWRRLSSDYDMTVQNLNTTRTQLEKAQREIAALGGRVTAQEEELRVETDKHRHSREELKAAKANLQYAKTQFTHEARKKEQELTALKDKLQKAVDRTTSASLPGGITILNPVPRTLYGKQQGNETELLLKEVIEQQQAKETEIVEENEQLRMTLYAIHVELENLIKKRSTLESSEATPYGLPFEMVKDKIETEIRDLLILFSNQWHHRPSRDQGISSSEVIVRDQMIEELQKDIQKLQLELEDSTLLVQGAQKMIDNLSSGNFLAGMQGFKLNVEESDMTLQEIDDAESKIQKQREDLVKERKMFTQACLDLGKQRQELEQAKRDFEENKMSFRLDKVMSLLSSPRLEQRTSDRTPVRTPDRTPDRTPSFSPPRFSEGLSKKRVATSPLSSCISDGRFVRAKTRTTVIEIPDDDSDDFQHSKSGAAGRLFDQDDNEVEAEEEEEEEEEVLIRRHHQRTNVLPSSSSSLGLEDLSRSHHGPVVGAEHERPGTGTVSSTRRAATPSETTATKSSASPSTSRSATTTAAAASSRTKAPATPGFSLFSRSTTSSAATTASKPPPSSKTSSFLSRAAKPTLASSSKSSSFNFSSSTGGGGGGGSEEIKSESKSKSKSKSESESTS